VNKLTAIRSFANPGFTPVKLRIYNNRWYLFTFQNIRTDQGGGHYLAEGEHTILLPGREARRARDRHLNHLNAIREHRGEVWEVTSRDRLITYHASETAAEMEASRQMRKNAETVAEVFDFFATEMVKSDDEILAMYGQCHGWPGNEAKELAAYRESLIQRKAENEAYWLKEIPVKRVK